jgi:hypothetical protein
MRNFYIREREEVRVEKLKNTTMRSTSKRVINKTFQPMASNNTPPAVLVVGSSFSF